MRLPEAKIKQAILHPEEEGRRTAAAYFSDARSTDYVTAAAFHDKKKWEKALPIE